MSETFAGLVDELPWLKSFLLWAFGAAVVLLVLAAPVYFMILPLFRELRAEISAYRNELRQRHKKNREYRAQEFEREVERYAGDHLLRLLSNTTSRYLGGARATLLKSAQEIQSLLLEVRSTLEGFTGALPRIQERLQAVSATFPKEAHALPTTTELGANVGELRVAKTTFVCVTVLLLGMIGVNMFMLGQILRDLGFIPPSLRFFNIPLYLILALIITAAEAGCGIIHAYFTTGSHSVHPMKIRLAPLAAAAGAVVIACIEGSFYSRIVPNRSEVVVIPIINHAVALSDYFFMWGFVLVLILFGLGLIWYTELVKIQYGTVLGTLRKQMRAFAKESDAWQESLRKLESITKAARAAAAAWSETSTGFAAAPVERFLKELQEILGRRPDWVDTIEQPAGKPEILQFAQQTRMWALVTVFAGLLATVAGYLSYSRMVSIDPPGWAALALGQAVLLVAAGSLLGWGEIVVVRGLDYEKVIGPQWARYLGLGLCGALILFWIVGLIGHAYPAGITLLWTFNLLVSASVFASAYQLLPLLGLMGLWTRRALHVTTGLLEAVWRSGIGLALMAVVALLYFLSIISGPFLVFERRRAERVAAVGPSTNDHSPHAQL